MALGKKTGGGSRKGVPNKKPTNATILAAVRDAAHSHRGGMKGYLKWLSKEEPKSFASLLARGMGIEEGQPETQVNAKIVVNVGGTDGD